jgi:choline-sulfatase
MGLARPYIVIIMAFRLPRRNLAALALAVALCCLAFLMCSRETRPNLIIIGIDTLRPDHLGCYGYGINTSPNIDRLAQEGAVFENTVSQSPWTFPSFATVFTSLYPMQHGAGSLRSRMRTGFPTLAEILSEAGYTTGAVIGSAVLDSSAGIARGFEDYFLKEGVTPRTADQVTGLALEWLDGLDGGPFFLFLHYWDPHDPYGPPAPYDTQFDPSYSGGMGNDVSLRALAITTAGQVGATLSGKTGMISSRDIEHALALYDGEIAFTDKWIGVLLQGLEDRGLKDNTAIVLHSDHGEEFFEHGGVGHGHALYDEVIKVPLLAVFPDVIPGGTRIMKQARLVDVAPTVLDLLGIPSDPGFEGVSLVSRLRDGSDPAPREGALFPPHVAYSEALKEGLEKKAVTAYPWKLIYELSSTEEMLFDRSQDPGETRNLAALRPEAAIALEELLTRALLETSEDWYVELAGGEGYHTFDIEISTEKATWGGWIYPFEVTVNGNRTAGDVMNPLTEAPGSVLKRSGLRVREPVIMGFKIHSPMGVRPRFDFRVDGEPAPGSTFIGEALANPKRMPFNARKPVAGSKSVSGPAKRPEPPYVLLWRVEGKYGGEAQVQSNERVKEQLRALGYVQ